jgi:hypothetical protein
MATTIRLQLEKVYSNQVNLFVDKAELGILDAEYLNVYVAVGEFATFYKVKGSIPYLSERGISDPRILITVSLAEVQSADISLAAVSFASTPLYFKATYVNGVDGESDLAEAPAKAVGTEGVRRGVQIDNYAKSAQLSALSEAARGWVAGASSARGALAVSSVPFYEDEFVIERTFSGTGVIATETIYLKNDPLGARAMLITYSNYSGTVPGKVEYTLIAKPAP